MPEVPGATLWTTRCGDLSVEARDAARAMTELRAILTEFVNSPEKKETR